MSLDTRRTRHGARMRRRHDQRAHDDVGGARSARRLARGSALVRCRRCRLWQSRTGDATQRARGAVMSLDTRRARHGARVFQRRDRRTHGKAGGARSARRLARGSALARHRGCRLRQSRTGDATQRARGAVMSLDTRRARHGVRVFQRRDRRTHGKAGGARSARRLARGSALARSRRCRL